MSVFIDSSIWFPAIVKNEEANLHAKEILASVDLAVTTDHVLVETWLLLNRRGRRDAAERFWTSIRHGIAQLEQVTMADLEAAWAIGEAFPDQEFSIVDKTASR